MSLVRSASVASLPRTSRRPHAGAHEERTVHPPCQGEAEVVRRRPLGAGEVHRTVEVAVDDVPDRADLVVE
jgi:hypothetical protein